MKFLAKFLAYCLYPFVLLHRKYTTRKLLLSQSVEDTYSLRVQPPYYIVTNDMTGNEYFMDRPDDSEWFCSATGTKISYYYESGHPYCNLRNKLDNCYSVHEMRVAEEDAKRLAEQRKAKFHAMTTPYTAAKGTIAKQSVMDKINQNQPLQDRLDDLMEKHL